MSLSPIAAAIGAGGAAQVHAGIFDIRHAAGEGLLGLFQQRFTVHRCIPGQILSLGVGRSQNFGGTLAAALDDLLLADQGVGAFLCFLDQRFGFDLGIL